MWLLCKTDKVTEVSVVYGMEINVVKTKVMSNARISMTCHIFILASFYMSN